MFASKVVTAASKAAAKASASTSSSASSKLQNLSPEVIRELRRHVSPKPLNTQNHEQHLQQLRDEAGNKLRWVLGSCLTLVAVAASFPLIATWWISLNEKEEALTAPQIRRGAFLNSGSRDVGRDPNWDFSKGKYKKESGYQAIANEEKAAGKRQPLPNQFLAMSDEQTKKHEAKIEAFAKGQARND